MKAKRNILSIVSIALTLVLGIGIGYITGESAARENTAPLRLTVTEEKDAGSRHITSEELGGNYDGITYVEVADVTIEIGSRTMKLEEAIRDGYVTVEQLIAQAKEDVRSRDCILKYDTHLGLSEFTYTYKDQYDLRVVYDVFECSDGAQYVISDFIITPPSKSRDISFGYSYIDDDGTRVDLLYEDWGLEFTVAEASSTDITLNYTQWGGMANGDLSVQWILMDNAQENKSLDVIDQEAYMDHIPITKNTTMGELTVNWQEKYGELSPGEYTIYLYIHDTYNEAEAHPLMQNYCNGQYFPITFTIS